MEIPSTPVTMGIASPNMITDAPAVTMLPAPEETEPKPPVPETALPMQSPIVECQLGTSYINNQSQQVTHDNTNISVCSWDFEAQENLKSHFNERLNDKIYTIFKELLCNTNIDSVCEILSKISMYNNKIARFIENINVKYGILLNYTQLESSEMHHWVETFQISTNPSNQLEAQ